MKDNPSGPQMFKRDMKIKDMVLEILKRHPSAKGDDRLLRAYFLRDYYRIPFQVSIRILRCLPSDETIRRRRQELQAEAKQNGDPDHILPSERVQEKRVRREDAYHGYYSDGILRLDNFEEG